MVRFNKTTFPADPCGIFAIFRIRIQNGTPWEVQSGGRGVTDREAGQGALGGQPLPNISISSASIGCKTAYETWRESVADVFNTRPGERTNLGEFPLEMSTFHPGPLVLGRFASGAQDFERSNRTIASGGLDHFLFQLYERGGFCGLANGAEIRVSAGDICILDLTRTLDTRATDFQNVTLIVPRSLLESFIDDVDALSGVVLAGDEPLTRMLARHMRSLHCEMARMSQDEAEAAARASAALIAVAAQRHARYGSTGSEPLVSRFRAIVAHIDANLHDVALTPRSICEDLGMSRASLYRMFASVGGVSEFIRIRRLEAAIRLLVSSASMHLGIAEIAFGCGFKTLSSFSKTFRNHFGLSPSEVRQSACENALSDCRTGGIVGKADFAYWLRTLV